MEINIFIKHNRLDANSFISVIFRSQTQTCTNMFEGLTEILRMKISRDGELRLEAQTFLIADDQLID